MPDFRAQRIFGKVVRLTLTFFVFAITALVLWRVFFSANIPDTIKPLNVNDRTRAAYEQYGDDMVLRYQNQKSLTYGTHNAGYFGVAEYVFIPQADQVQVVLRYNNSTLKNLAKDYGLSAIPDKAGDYFDVTLLHVTDLTPDNAEDNADPAAQQRVRIAPTSVTRDTTSLYTYYRLVFDGVTIDEQAISHVFLDIYYVEDLDYEKDPYGTLLLYDHLHEWLPRKLTKADKQAFQEQ